MPDNEEKRKAAVGVVTPNADKDEDWRRQVAGVYSFNGAPGNTVAPSVSIFPMVDLTISTTNGTWSGSPTTYTYQWRVADDGSGTGAADITGATSYSLLLLAEYGGKYVSAIVTATNDEGSTDATATLLGTTWIYVFEPVAHATPDVLVAEWDEFTALDGVDIFNETIGDATDDLIPLPLSFNASLNARYRAPWFCVASEFNSVVGRETDAFAGCGATLISPTHVLMVHHCEPSAVYFKQADGTEIYREIEWTDWIASDLSVGRLNAEVTTIDPVAVLASSSTAVGKYGALIEAGRFLSRVQVTDVSAYFSATPAVGESGDSGHPVFIANGDRPVLVGIVSSPGTSNIGHSATVNIDRINAVLAVQGETLDLVSLSAYAGGASASSSPNISPSFSPTNIPIVFPGA